MNGYRFIFFTPLTGCALLSEHQTKAPFPHSKKPSELLHLYIERMFRGCFSMFTFSSSLKMQQQLYEAHIPSSAPSLPLHYLWRSYQRSPLSCLSTVPSFNSTSYNKNSLEIYLRERPHFVSTTININSSINTEAPLQFWKKTTATINRALELYQLRFSWRKTARWFFSALSTTSTPARPSPTVSSLFRLVWSKDPSHQVGSAFCVHCTFYLRSLPPFVRKACSARN